MSQFTTEEMSRLVAAGTRDQLKTAIDVVAGLSMVHINDYSSTEEGLSMGSPTDESESISRRLTKMRGAASNLQAADQRELLSAPEVRRTLSGPIDEIVDSALERFEELDALRNEASQIDEELEVLQMLTPLSLELDLMGGYQNVTSFIGTVSSLTKARPALAGLGDSAIHMSSEVGKSSVVAVFCRNTDAPSVHEMLSNEDFQAISIPDSEGLPSDRILQLQQRKAEINEMTEELELQISDWSESNGGMLFGGMELLERDLELATAPVRVAVSNHAFVLDGWVNSETAPEVEVALSSICTHVSIEKFTPPAHSSHLHHDEDVSELPPIAFSPRNYSKPFEMLTDVMGRPAYGRIDPTFFMFLTYPLFFGLILGDMAYGLAVMGMAWFIWRRFPINQ